MTAPPARPDVVVAGGGLIGLGVAWRAAQRGLAVTVVDPAPGSGASYAAAGMLAPASEVWYGEEALLALALDSLARYPAFVAEVAAASGLPVPLATAGTLLVAVDGDDLTALRRRQAHLDTLGLPAELLAPSGCRRREPELGPRLRGGLAVTGDGAVEPRALHAALRVAAERAGVVVRRERVGGLVVDGGRVTGLRLDGGATAAAGTVVLALGAESARLPGLPAGSVPVRPVKGQVLRLRGEPLLAGTVRALVAGREVYLVPRPDGEVVVGATVEERGFDARPTAGGVHDLLHDALEVVPALSELELAETTVRFRPGTPDNAPLLGPGPLPGLVLATGHHRNGVLLTPVTADAVAALLADGALPDVAAPFSPNRFAGRAVA